MDESKKVIIVEGRSDKQRIENIITEKVDIICTNGTLSMERLDDMIDEQFLFEREVFVLVDADKAGEKLRKQLKRELPHAIHIYIDKMYREVATTPIQHLATVLIGANIQVDVNLLK